MRIGGGGKAAVSLGVIRAKPEPQRIHLACELKNPVTEHLPGFIASNRAAIARPMVAQEGVAAGKVLALCGAGPSLASRIIVGADDIWACNSALPYLVARGDNVTAGVGIDQTDGLLKEWESAPDVPYLVASSCDPALIQHLSSRGRSLTFFHNYVGVPDETALYKQWPSTLMVTNGYSVVSRVINLAAWMGYDRIDVYGADCQFGPDDRAHANGDSATDAYGRPMIWEYELDGKRSRTRMDMLMDAVWLTRLARNSQGRIRLIGDTLPNALMEKDDAFLDLVCRTLTPEEAQALNAA